MKVKLFLTSLVVTLGFSGCYVTKVSEKDVIDTQTFLNNVESVRCIDGYIFMEPKPGFLYKIKGPTNAPISCKSIKIY